MVRIVGLGIRHGKEICFVRRSKIVGSISVLELIAVDLWCKQYLKMEKHFKSCQSCGMPMSRDEQGGGSNADGSKSLKYCSHCWEDGKFISPDLTVDEMKARVKEKIMSFGVPGFLAGVFTWNIPKLERWK